MVKYDGGPWNIWLVFASDVPVRARRRTGEREGSVRRREGRRSHRREGGLCEETGREEESPERGRAL